ncbi:hypothetical protein ACW4TU_43775 [Streptomyces sp. QTS52]
MSITFDTNQVPPTDGPRSNATVIRRTPLLVRDDPEPSLFLSLQISGSSMVMQGGREAVLRRRGR